MSNRKTGGDRAWKWGMKYTAEHVADLINRTKPKMQEHVNAAFNELVDFELATKDLLNHHPVSVTEIPGYLCFTREMWKAKNKYAGKVLCRETGVKIAKWQARGLDDDIMWDIAFNIYNVERPVA